MIFVTQFASDKLRIIFIKQRYYILLLLFVCVFCMFFMLKFLKASTFIFLIDRMNEHFANKFFSKFNFFLQMCKFS